MLFIKKFTLACRVYKFFLFQSLGEGLFSVDELDDLLKDLTKEEIKELSAIDPDVRPSAFPKPSLKHQGLGNLAFVSLPLDL